jgi:hypothetical protein
MLGYVPVAMGYVKKAFTAVDQPVEVLAETERAQARVRTLPFWVKRPAGTDEAGPAEQSSNQGDK